MNLFRSLTPAKKKNDPAEAVRRSQELFALKQVELDTKHDELDAKFEKQLAELDERINDSIAAQAYRLTNLVESRARSFDDLVATTAQAHSESLAELEHALGSRLEEAMRRLEAVEPELKRNRAELDNVSARAARELQGVVVELRQLEEQLRKAEASAREGDGRCMAAVDTQVRESQALRAEIGRLDQRCEALQVEIDGLRREQEAARAAAEKAELDLAFAQREAEREAKEREGQLGAELRSEMERGLAEAEERGQVHDRELTALAESLRVSAEKLEVQRNLAENVHSRLMSWRLKNFHKRLAALISGDTDMCFQSPPFRLSTLPEMCLEMQLAGRDGGVLEGPLRAVPVPVPGSMTLRLWAQPNLHLCFRVAVGEGGAAIVKRFEHSFSEGLDLGLPPDERGRYCFAMENFCVLDHVWAKSNDTLLVVIEVLEFHCEPAPEVVRRLSVENSEAPSPGEAPSETSTAPSFDKASNDEVAFGQSGSSEVLLQERVRNELQAMRNRSVRRVEWRVEGCQRMLDVCKVGESIESPPFCAAGLDRVVFHFYPKGYDTTANTGATSPCALYISGPVRTTLRGTLWVGSISRQLEHRFRYKGDTGGRSKFSALDTQYDCNDAVLIALDITEVEMDLAEIGGSLVLRDARPTSPNSSGPKRSRPEGVPFENSKGILRMKREDPLKTEELVRCVSLPTLSVRNLHAPLVKGRKGIGF